jgi:hypothetical protein
MKFDPSDVHFVRVHSSEYFDHCDRHATTCAVRCQFINPDHAKPACRTGFAGLPNRWRCVIVSTYTLDQLAEMKDRNGMPIDQHEIRHCEKGEDHGY